MFGKRLDFLRVEEETMARLAHQPDIATRIFVHYHANVELTLVILFDRLNEGCFARECNVKYVAARSGTQPDPAPGAQLPSRDMQCLDRCLGFEKLPFPFVHGVSLPSGWRSRSVLWSFMRCSADSPSVLSRIFRARASEYRISRFSSSVIVIMRSARISSISVPSKRSPGLSGAICG